jgi:thiol-disulfide isomerase/thioredoxin
MKILTLLTTLAIAPIALAHPDHDPKPDHPEHPGDHPEHPGDHPEHPSDDTGDSKVSDEIAAQVEALLQKVHTTYKNATAITETITLTMPAMMPGEDAETMKVNIALSKESGEIVAEESMTAAWTNGKFYMTLAEKENAYVVQDAKSFGSGLQKATGDEGMPGLWTVSMREDDTLAEWLNTFSIGMPGTEIVGITAQTQDDGTAVEVIELKTMMGSINIAVTGENMINNVTMVFEQPGMPAMEMTAVAETAFVDTIPVVTFDAGDREKFASLDDMFAGEGGGGPEGGDASGLDGKIAPDFTLATLDGSGDVTLSSLKGSVVVLDFWATWCPPCKKGLPFLNEFDAWTQEEGLNVKVFAVDVWERGEADAILEKVTKFWSDNKYKTKVLMGSGSDALTKEYGVSGIPTTVIIGTDGKVIETHVGFSPNMVDVLKKAVTAALSTSNSDHPEHPGDHPEHPGG